MTARARQGVFAALLALSAAVLAAAPAIAGPGPPDVQTQAPTSVASTSAVLHGLVNPRTRMTSICPRASMMRMAVSSSTPARLRGAANPGNATTTATSNTSVSNASLKSRRAASDQSL